MFRIIAATAFVLSLPFAAFAQDVGTEQMKDLIMTNPDMQGVDIDLDMLTDEQLSQIMSILDGDDDMADKQMAVKEVAGM